MLTYIVAFCLALLVSAMVTPFVTRLAHVYGWLDIPSEARKIHSRAIPRVGGIAVVLAFFAPILSLALYTNRISDLLYSDLRLVFGLFVGALCIVGLGVYDDIKGAKAHTKLFGQIFVALGMWCIGFRIELLGAPLGAAWPLGLLSLPLTIIWIVGVINALNLIDGLDGLASGIALFAAIVLFSVAFADRSVLLCLMTAALAGSLVGFLFFNFNPAKIFLGDSGSMFLGFLLASISIWTQRKGATAAALLIPVLALGLPILDTTLSFVRRVKNGKSPFEADKEHLHHRLLALGLSHRNAVLTLYTVSIVFCVGALALLDNAGTRQTIILSSVVVVAIILIRRVGMYRKPLPPIASRDEVRTVVRAIRQAQSPSDAWSRLISILPFMGSVAVRLKLACSPDTPNTTRELVYSWQRSDMNVMSSEEVEKHPKAERFTLNESGEEFGELVIIFEPQIDFKQQPTLQLYAELLTEGLIEHRIDRQEIQADVFHLVEARQQPRTSLAT